MDNNALTIEQSKDLCERYQYLVGEMFTEDTVCYMVKCVAISPYDKINMLLFLELFKEMKDVSQAICFYKAASFDVAVILQQMGSNKTEHFKVLNLRSYLEKKNMGRGEPIIISKKHVYQASL